MSNGPNQPQQHGHGGRRRRRRHGRPHQHQNQGGQQQGQGQQGGGGGGGRRRRGGGGRNTAFVGPMDHSYRNAQGFVDGNGNGNANRFRGGRGNPQVPQFFEHPQLDPLPPQAADVTRIFAFIDDLFFQTKIQDTARKLNVKVEFVKSEQDILTRLDAGEEKPSLIIFDLNNVNAKPLSAIPKLKSRLKRDTSIIGFVSHVQGDLKLKAQEAGCDAVMPRSAFSQTLPQLLRRHGAPEETDQIQ